MNNTQAVNKKTVRGLVEANTRQNTLRNDDVWRQVFCAALTGILANPNNNTGTVDKDTDDAFDAVQFAEQVADEALNA